QDIAYTYNTNHESHVPISRATAVDVIAAFSNGGFPESGGSTNRTHSIRPLWIYTGSRWAVRTGGQFYYTHPVQSSESNFNGTFQFSDLDSYRLRKPATYRITHGDPRVEITHIEWSGFVQTDFKYSKRLTFLFGLRSEGQNDLADRVN